MTKKPARTWRRRLPPKRMPNQCLKPSEEVVLCRCDCGREIYVCKDCLISGRITSCGECDR